MFAFMFRLKTVCCLTPFFVRYGAHWRIAFQYNVKFPNMNKYLQEVRILRSKQLIFFPQGFRGRTDLIWSSIMVFPL